MSRRFAAACLAAVMLLATTPSPGVAAAAADPLPSWNDGPAKAALLDFVARVTDEGGPDFVAGPERIAAFDNDGTLWCEQPIDVQAAFAFDRARALAGQDPSLREKPAFRAILSDDRATMARLGESEIAELVGATHAGMSPEAFRDLAREWLAHAEHPRFARPYTSCVYQPQLEWLAYLREHDFRVFIVTGGGVDFVRAFSEEA